MQSFLVCVCVLGGGLLNVKGCREELDAEECGSTVCVSVTERHKYKKFQVDSNIISFYLI